MMVEHYFFLNNRVICKRKNSKPVNYQRLPINSQFNIGQNQIAGKLRVERNLNFCQSLNDKSIFSSFVRKKLLMMFDLLFFASKI